MPRRLGPVSTRASFPITSVRFLSSKPPKDGELPSPVDSTSPGNASANTASTKRRITVYPKAKLGKLSTSSASTSSLRGKDDDSKLKMVGRRRSKKHDESVGNSSSSPANNNSGVFNSNKLKSKRENDNVDSVVVAAPEYIPFDKFPKVPQSILDQPVEELYKFIDEEPPVNIQDENQMLSPEAIKQKKETYVDFAIPDKYLKYKTKDEITAKDRALVEELDKFLKLDDDEEIAQSQLKLIKLYYDQDSNTFQPLPEHTLKKSLLGMINLNPSLDEIDDEYLWKILPKGKLFGLPPFESKISPDGFKNWEKEMLERKHKENSARAIDAKEFNDFQSQLTDSKSFYAKTGARRKLNRKLVKKYKQLKEEGKIPKDMDKDPNDDNDDLL